MSNRLSLQSLHKSFGQTCVIPHVDLDIQAGEFVVFVGPSGCGKSTLLRLIAGLEDATQGHIYIDGEEVTHTAPAERGIAMVFQSYALYPHMTVEENMSFGLRMNGVDKAERKQRVDAAADILQLTPYLNRKPKELSGGQRQRVAIGRAIVRNPKIFLFDEPLSNLDAELRVEMRLQIAKLHKQLGDASMIYVTHDQVEAMTMADRIAILNAGEVVQFGSPMSLYQHPVNQFVAGFIGSPKMNFLKAVLKQPDAKDTIVQLSSGQCVSLPIDTSRSDKGDAVTLGIRPEDLHANGEAANPIQLQVDVVEQLGARSYFYGMAEGSERFVAESKANSFANNHKHETLSLSFASQRAYLFDSEGVAYSRQP